jgi:hypothetical protein
MLDRIKPAFTDSLTQEFSHRPPHSAHPLFRG